jgi:hypothetical protein
MDPRDLRSCVEAAIKELIEPEAWRRCEVSNAAEKASIRDFLDTWKGWGRPDWVDEFLQANPQTETDDCMNRATSSIGAVRQMCCAFFASWREGNPISCCGTGRTIGRTIGTGGPMVQADPFIAIQKRPSLLLSCPASRRRFASLIRPPR